MTELGPNTDRGLGAEAQAQTQMYGRRRTCTGVAGRARPGAEHVGPIALPR